MVLQNKNQKIENVTTRECFSTFDLQKQRLNSFICERWIVFASCARFRAKNVRLTHTLKVQARHAWERCEGNELLSLIHI